MSLTAPGAVKAAAPAASPSRLGGRSWFFSAMSGVVLTAAAVGFGRTYLAPLSRGTFAAPPVIHVHGALAATWVLLFAVQPLLVRWRSLRWHRAIGRIGLPVAIGVALTMAPAGMVQVTRDVSAGGGATAISGLLGVITSATLFVALVTVGIVMRHDREAHARWLLLATLVVAWPAWFRFRHWFPSVPRPDIWFAVVLADVWIVVAVVRDRLTRGAVHPVLAWAGTGVILEQTFEVLAFDTALWRAAAQWCYQLLRVVGP